MKKLHKKISAFALASMVAAGGFAASGVKAHADSYYIPGIGSLVDRLVRYDQIIYHEVKGYAEQNGGKIISVYDNKNDMIKDINRRFKNNKSLIDNLRVPVDCGWGPSRSIRLEIEHHRENIIHVSYYGVYFLIIF